MFKHKLNHIIQNQVDLILFEEGCFIPLNWMQRSGHLDSTVYLNWKEGRFEYLEDGFITPTAEILSTLEDIQEYASIQKLASYKNSYTSVTSQALHVCRSSANEHFFTTIYEPAQDRMQMDLFFDSAQAITVSDLIRAIVDKHSARIEDLLIKLEYSDIDKHHQFTQLLAYEKEIIQGTATCEKKIVLIQEMTPLAYDLLHRFTHDFITPLWHKLSDDIRGLTFDSNAPDIHLSFTAYKGFQWQQVMESIKQEQNWIKHPILIFRYAEACFKLNREQEAIVHWFNLFIQFPLEAELFIKKGCSQIFMSDWQAFTELDPELESSLFPAWMVMETPALAKNALVVEKNTNQPLELIKNLVSISENKLNVDLRIRLQKISPALFVHYMKNIANSK